jgi:hypothetical protein
MIMISAGVVVLSLLAARGSSSDLPSLLVNPVVWAIVGFCAGIYLFFRGFALLSRKRFISNVPRCTIRGASIGLVEVSGKAEGPYTIIAPLSEEDCFYYRTIAWTGGERNRRKACEESLSAPFFLDDGTGKLMIDARGAQTELEAAFSDEYSGSVPAYAQRFLNRHGISELPVRIEEYVVRQGETLFAMGMLRENTATESADRPQFVSREAAALQRDQELGGVILPGAAVARKKPVNVDAAEQFDVHPPVVLGGNGSNHPLFLSCRSQREVVQALAWQSAFYIWGGPILSLFCFWYLLRRLAY